ncbi:MAG: hypothetical protein OHK0045_09300 [Raineya sp.]
MKKKTSILSLLLFCFLQSQAQDYFVSIKGDTVRGYILKSFKATNARKLSYKLDEGSAEVEIFLPNQVQEFRAGNTFVAVEVSQNGEKERLFLQEIIKKGKVWLYKGVDENGTPDYFVKKNEQVIPVDRVQLEIFIEQNFADCPQFNREKYLPSPSDAYRQDFLMDLVSHYNHCIDPQIPYISYFEAPKKKKTRDEVHFGAKAAAGMQEYAYRSFGTGANADLYGTGLFNWQPSFALGLYANVQYGKIFGVYLEATYLYRNAKSTDQRIEINFSGINLPFYTEFKMWHTKKVSPFVGLGLNTLIGIRQKYRFNDPPNITQLRPLSISPVSFGYLANVGLYIKRERKPLKFELRFTEDFFEVNNRTFGDDKMRVANFMLMFSYPLL